jgi:hypothetical protein
MRAHATKSAWELCRADEYESERVKKNEKAFSMPFVNNRGIHIRYEVEGQGPSLVLHHGFSENLTTWY